ncbi:MAG: hypothetical protein AAF490_04020 [Chloroflexota bacterium]
MKTYRSAQWTVVLIIVIYTAVSYTTTRFRGSELFPFFNWSLFTKVPNEKHDFGLRLLTVDGEPLSEPIYFEEADAWFDEAHSIVAYQAIQQFGSAVREADETTIEEIRPFVESTYLENQTVRYELVRRTYLPISRVQTGAFVNEEVLGQFEVGGAP